MKILQIINLVKIIFEELPYKQNYLYFYDSIKNLR